MSIELKLWTLGFIDCGQLANIIVSPLLERGLLNPRNIWVTETKQCISSYWSNEESSAVRVSSEPHLVAQNSDIIFIGFELDTLPNGLNSTILPSASDENPFKHKLIVSFIPDMTCRDLAKIISEYGLEFTSIPIMRVLPNIPVAASEGLFLYCRDRFHTEVWASPVVELLSYHGMIKEVEESLMDIAAYVPAMCGPAYVYLMIEAMVEGAVKNDLPRDLAIKFVAQVFAGAAKMVLKTGKHPGQLKDEACEFVGSAIDGIHELEVGCMRASLINAVDATAKKLKERKAQFQQIQ